MAHMVRAAGLLRQTHVPGDGAPFALRADAPVTVGAGVRPVVDIAAPQQAVVLAVGRPYFPQAAAFLHGLPHDALRLDAPSVVGEGDHIRGHTGQIRQMFPLLAHSDRAVGVDMYRRRLRDQPLLERQRGAAVRNGVQIGHGGHVGKASVSGGHRAGADGLLIRKSRLSKMYMHIHETGK